MNRSQVQKQKKIRQIEDSKLIPFLSRNMWSDVEFIVH